jgi:hypothetical protein
MSCSELAPGHYGHITREELARKSPFQRSNLESRDASQQELSKCESAPSEQACGHRLRPHVKGKVKGAKGIRLKRFTV